VQLLQIFPVKTLERQGRLRGLLQQFAKLAGDDVCLPGAPEASMNRMSPPIGVQRARRRLTEVPRAVSFDFGAEDGSQSLRFHFFRTFGNPHRHF
jgi:hypothetical protein